jgi:conjugative relaxase-like TrwC/TraI family protein
MVGIMVRFDKPCVVVKGAVEYFREHMAVGDYLTHEGRVEMTWQGVGAERLGLTGSCQLAHFENLCAGLHPVSGAKLMVRDKGENRRVCYFGQLSPPKDVSVLHLVGEDERIGRWWQEAVTETLREMEALTATRVRRAGQNFDRRTGHMVAGVVTHDANRALDPQLHTHVCIINLTYDATEGRWKGVQPSGFYRHQGYLREVCYNKLAGLMTAAGYELEPGQRLGFAVKGVPPELRELFSKRRREILRQAAETGAHSQDALQAIAVRSRAGKTKATAASLRAGWLAEAGPHLEALRAVVAGAQGRPAKAEPITPLDALHSAEAHVFERKSVVDDRLLLREALIAGRGQVALAALKRALASRERAGELIRVDEEIASRAGLEAEREFTGWASAQGKGRKRLGTVPAGKTLSPDQTAAVRNVLSATSGVVILQGDAGTGKTSCLKTIVAGIEQAGGRVFGCAPSAGAADVLRRELTAEADTLQQLLANETMQQAIKGRVLIVDEAGLVSVRQMRDLCRLAARHDHRLLLVGDSKQHASVEAGDALRCLQEFARVPVCHLTEIRRQVDPAYRQAVARLARGDAFGAFNQFSRLGAVREIPEGAGLWQEAAADYVRTVRAGKSCLAISPVWAEIREYTAAVRTQLRHAGVLTGDEHAVTTVESCQWTQAERCRAHNYRPGDVLTFHHAWGSHRKFDAVAVVRQEERQLVVRGSDGCERRLDPRRASGFEVGTPVEISLALGDRLLIRANVKPANLRNGDLVEVAGIGRDGEIALKDGRVLPVWFRGFTHGYAATSHAAQGKTVDRGILLMAEAGIAAGNLKQAYVSNSRFRESQMIYTSDKEAARDAMMRLADRKLALEMTGADQPENPSPRKSWRAQWAARQVPSVRVQAA